MDMWKLPFIEIVAIAMVEELYKKTVIIVADKDSHTKRIPTVVLFVVEVVIGKREFPSVNVLIVKVREIPNKVFLLGHLEQDAQDAMVKEIYIKRKKRIAIIVNGDMCQK